jgi:cyclopropane fatty-acyl-phospholipid synthase-like methyltransferase
MDRTPEPERMDLQHEVDAYAAADFTDVNTRFASCVMAIAGDAGAAALIDLGCGPGDIALMLARARPAWSVVGLDASEPMLRIARLSCQRQDIANCRFELRDIRDPHDLGPFDFVCSNSLLHHLGDHGAFWGAVKRLGRRGTQVLVRDLFRPESRSAARAIVRQYAGNESDLLKQEFYRSLLSAYTPDEVRQQLRANGLEQLAVELVSDRHMDIVGQLG